MIVWVDVESSGLDPRNDHLLEVALVVTDDDLNEIAATSIVCQPVGTSIDVMVANLDPVVLEMHSKNGLIAELRAGAPRRGCVRRYEAEDMLIAFLGQTVADRATVLDMTSGVILAEALKRTPLAGSTVGFDRAFLREHMPTLEAMFSYRSVDVSSFTEMAKRWAPQVYEGRPKAEKGAAHRALADARESIEYLRYYRRVGFLNTSAIRSGAFAKAPFSDDPHLNALVDKVRALQVDVEKGK